MQAIVFVVPALLTSCSCRAQDPGKQSRPPDYRDEIARARDEVIDTARFRIVDLNLGEPAIGENRFSAFVTNKTDQELTIGLDLRVAPGYWLRKWQGQSAFRIAPRESKRIEATYELAHITDEAWLRVRFGVPEMLEGRPVRIADPFIERQYAVGSGNPALDTTFSQFELHATEHFDLYVHGGYLSAEDVEELTKERELAYTQIADLLAVEYPKPIHVFLYSDGESKKNDTGHTGNGWAIGNNIIEIYNEETRLDPYHELTHILAGQLGQPPALFDEGLAVYVAERFGADALRYLVAPGVTVAGAAGLYARTGQLFSLEILLAFEEIGSSETRPGISYPQAASVVEYLIENHGMEKFLEAYGRLEDTSSPEGVRRNAAELRAIYGMTIEEIEAAWLAGLTGE